MLAIGKYLDVAQRTVDVHAESKDDTPTLLPGMFIEARIILADEKDVEIVTKAAYFLMVQSKKGEAGAGGIIIRKNV